MPDSQDTTTEQASQVTTSAQATAIDEAWDKTMEPDEDSVANLLEFPDAITGTPKTDEKQGDTVTDGKTEQASATEVTTDDTSVTQDTKTDKEAETSQTDADGTIAVDPSLRALALEQGADEASLDSLIKTNPDAANELLIKLADQFNATTLQGLQQSGSNTTDPAYIDATVTSDGETTPSPLVKFLADEKALADLTETVGEPFVEQVLKPLQAEFDKVAQEREFFASLREQLEAAQQQNLIETLDQTFRSFGEPYKDFYGGAEIGKLTPAQLENRGSVGDLADDIKASQIRRGLTPKADKEYLVMAHHVVAAGIRSKAARKSIIDEIKTRAGGITSRPSSQRVTEISTEPSDEAASAAVDRKLAELGLETLFPDG